MKNFKRNYYRLVPQWLVLLFLAYMVIRLWSDPNYIADFEAYCPFGGALALSSLMVNNTLACSMTEAQIFMGIMLVVGVIIFSKLFCSYVCPLGTVTEYLANLGKKIKLHFSITGIADRLLRVLKYALLFATFYFTVKASELFCREYDPFYAIFTGFGHDVVFWYALPAVILTIVGSVFIRQFWCKYMCPLGAGTNLFANIHVFVVVFGLYGILLLAGIEISWVWPLAIVCAGGFAAESITMKSWYVPFLKITRNEHTCTNCQECDASCPMDIPVSEYETVNHIDCHLCQDCVYSCPESKVLQINSREMRPVPMFATFGLFLIGLYLATTIELPTINMRWGNEDKLATAAVFEQDGIKNIKCFGSSRSFATKMRRVEGILGVETYVQSKGVKIYYDPEKLTHEDVKESIFTPTKSFIRIPSEKTDSVSVLTLKVDKLFDEYDSFYFKKLLSQQDGIYALETKFGEPVDATVYFDKSKVSPAEIGTLIEQDQIEYTSAGKTIKQPLRFEVADLNLQERNISKKDMFENLFSPYSVTFNNFDDYDPEQLAIYQIYMPQALTASKRALMFLISHVSMDDYVVKFETVFLDNPYANIYFVKDKTSADSVYQSLQNEKMTVVFSNDQRRQFKNPFSFKKEGKILP